MGRFWDLGRPHRRGTARPPPRPRSAVTWRGAGPGMVYVCALADCTRLLISSHGFRTSKPTGLCRRLPPHLTLAGVVFRTFILLLTPISILRTNTGVHPNTTHLPQLTRGSPHPKKKKTWCISSCKSVCLALDEVNSRLISPLLTWVWSPTHPPPLSPAV